MSITSVLTAVTSLIADNFLTLPWFILTLFIVLMFYMSIRRVYRERDWYYVFVIALWVILYLAFWISLDTVVTFFIFLYGKIRG